MRTGAERIADERRRQIAEKGYDAEHDGDHGESLAWAAVCYAAPGRVYRHHEFAHEQRFVDPWPWEDLYDKRPRSGNVLKPPTPKERIRSLEKAGALIAAEIDRLLLRKPRKKAGGR